VNHRVVCGIRLERLPNIDIVRELPLMDLVQLDDPGCSLPVYISPQIEEMMG
jgi:hypothetical protein